MRRPMPLRAAVEISATTTPITAPAAASLSAGTRNGTALGKRSVRMVCPPVAAKLRISSSEVAGADSSPRNAPTATGKKARNAPRIVTDSHRGHSHPPSWSLPPQLTTSGARAISGTVWDTTRYGSRPRRTMPKRAITVASPIPIALPSRKPATASRNEYQDASRTTCQMWRSDWLFSVSVSARPISHTWGIAVSLARGRMRMPIS